MSQHHVPIHQSESDPMCDRFTGDKVLCQIRNSWIVQLEKWWEQEAVQSPLCLDSCLLRLRSRRLGELSCGALDVEFDAEEDAAREMYSQSDL